ncbi:DNA adenine methylase [Acidocella sp.]|uniref:DNA adenine methylase n=1 Tax=Acidocella sp. TaxID=50710 RepID=UPI003D05120F
MDSYHPQLQQPGRYSPLRYPGGKGKIARFMRDIIRLNDLSDGRYVEPYAGGAAVAWELLITGIVRRVEINDVSRPVYAFWNSVLNRTDALCNMIEKISVTVSNWDQQKDVFRQHETADELELGFAFFFLNRTNRSGILNGGIIGGREQTGLWKIDARYNKEELVHRIRKIASHRSRIQLTMMDAQEFILGRSKNWKSKTLVYIDPPYFEKGRYLYYDAYEPKNHASIANSVRDMAGVNWIVSYDDVRPIHDLYQDNSWLQYTLNYSARRSVRGREAMFFSDNLKVPNTCTPLVEIDRDIGMPPRPVNERQFAT